MEPTQQSIRETFSDQHRCSSTLGQGMLSVASRCTCYLLENIVHCLTGGEASSPSSPRASGSDSDLHRDISQVNDSLYLLHKPEGTPNIQIVLFHSLQFEQDYSNSHVSTWKNQDGSCIWPQTWLVEDFPRAHVIHLLPRLGTEVKWKRGHVHNRGKPSVGSFAREDWVLLSCCICGPLHWQIGYQAVVLLCT